MEGIQTELWKDLEQKEVMEAESLGRPRSEPCCGDWLAEGKGPVHRETWESLSLPGGEQRGRKVCPAQLSLIWEV